MDSTLRNEKRAKFGALLKASAALEAPGPFAVAPDEEQEELAEEELAERLFFLEAAAALASAVSVLATASDSTYEPQARQFAAA